MELGEIYEKGRDYFKERDLGRLLDYVETGFAEQNDRRVLDRYLFKQQCLNAQEADTRCTVLGVELSTPVIMSAMTMPIPAMSENGLMKVARGLKAAGSLMWTGTPLPSDLKEISRTGVPLAANVKPFKDRRRMYSEMEQILASGVTWLGLEMDAGQGTKVRDREMGFECLPLTSKEIASIAKEAPVPVICKGVLSREDALRCAEAGARGIVVSHHGGHTLDYLPHPLQVMDEIIPALKGEVAIIVDGGFRRGSDVLKGLAFGAHLVGLGRPILYALAAGGEQGVCDLVEAITRELRRLMTMTGVPSPSEAHRDILIVSQP